MICSHDPQHKFAQLQLQIFDTGILCNVKVVADKQDGVFLMATDTELGIRVRVNADVLKNGEALLPPKQFLQILESANEAWLTLEGTKTGISLTGGHYGKERWTLDTQSPDEYPIIADFTETAYHEIPAFALHDVIRSTMFAVDDENDKFTLGGVCFESGTDGAWCAVATDGRRLAVKTSVGTNVNGHTFAPAILPVNTLKLLSKVLKDKSVHVTDSVKMAIHTTVKDNQKTSGSVQFHCNGVTLFSRMLEGRFPKWQSIMPTTDDRLHAQIRCETLRTAVKQMITSDLEPGVLFAFRRGSLTLASLAKESGQAKAVLPLSFDGTADFIFDLSYIRDFLRVLEADTVVDIFMAAINDPVLFVTGDGYRYLVMPIDHTKFAIPANVAMDTEPETAKPDADTGVEVVGQTSTEEEPMKQTDKSPCPDNDMETKVCQLLQENDQLRAKTEHYKALLERAMRLLEKTKADQCLCA